MHAPRLRPPAELALPALLTALVVLLLVVPAGALAHARPLLLEGLALGGVALALARMPPGSLIGRAGLLLRAGPNLPLLLLVAYALVSARLAPYKGLASTEWLRLAGGVILYFGVAYAAQVRDRYRTVVDGLIGIALVGTLTEMARSAHSESPMSAVFGNRQLLASFLLLLMPLMLAVSLAARNGKRKIGAQVAFIVVAAGLIMAQTRSAWAGALVSLTVLGVIAAAQTAGLRQLARAKHRAALVLIPLLGAVGLFVALWLSSPALVSRLRTLGDLPGDVNAQWRLHQWAGTWQMITAHPWFGWGLGSYAVVINRFVPDGTPLDLVLRHGANLTQNAHCLYLQMLAEVGIVGTALYLWALGAFFVTGVRALRRSESPSRFAVLAACLAAVAGQIVDAAANPAYQFGEVSLFFWLVVGLGMAAARIAPRPEVAPAAVDLRRLASRRLAWQGAMLSAAGVVLASGLALGQDFLPAQPVYSQVTLFTVTARSGSTGIVPGYLGPVVMSGECIEVQVGVQFAGSSVYQAERSPAIQYTIGGTAPAGCVVEQPSPNPNVFCVPSTAGAECNGTRADITASYTFRGQTFSKTVSFDILGATCGIPAMVDRPVLPATGNLETVNVTFGSQGLGKTGGQIQAGSIAPQVILEQVQIYPDPTLYRPGNVVSNGNGTQLQLKADPGLTYVLLYRLLNGTGGRCEIRLVVLVSTRTAFETPAAATM